MSQEWHKMPQNVAVSRPKIGLEEFAKSGSFGFISNANFENDYHKWQPISNYFQRAYAWQLVKVIYAQCKTLTDKA